MGRQDQPETEEPAKREEIGRPSPVTKWTFTTSGRTRASSLASRASAAAAPGSAPNAGRPAAPASVRAAKRRPPVAALSSGPARRVSNLRAGRRCSRSSIMRWTPPRSLRGQAE